MAMLIDNVKQGVEGATRLVAVELDGECAGDYGEHGPR